MDFGDFDGDARWPDGFAAGADSERDFEERVARQRRWDGGDREDRRRDRERQHRRLVVGADDEAVEVPDGDGDGEAAEPTFRPARSPHLDELDEQLGPLVPGEPDPGCDHFRDDTASIAFEAYVGFVKLFSKRMAAANYIRLAKQCARFYETKIRKPYNETLQPGEKPLPKWSARSIYVHFTEHQPEHTLSAKTNVEIVRRMIIALDNHGVWVEGRVGDEVVKVPSERGINMMDKLMRMHDRAYNSKRHGSTMFASAVYGNDAEAIAPVLDISDGKVHAANPDRFYGRSVLSGLSDAGRGSTIQAQGKRDKEFATTAKSNRR